MALAPLLANLTICCTGLEEELRVNIKININPDCYLSILSICCLFVGYRTEEDRGFGWKI